MCILWLYECSQKETTTAKISTHIAPLYIDNSMLHAILLKNSYNRRQSMFK